MTNLIYNYHWKSGSYNPNGIKEINVPNDWSFDYEPDTTGNLPGQNQHFGRPRVDLVSEDFQQSPLDRQFPPNAYDNGKPIVNIYANWMPTWCRLSQSVAGDRANLIGEHNLQALVMLNVWDYWEVGSPARYPVHEKLAGEVRLVVRQVSETFANEWTTPWLLRVKPDDAVNYGQWINKSLHFEVPPWEVYFDLDISIEFRARWGNQNNGLLIAQVTLE